jgi:hypothetical protein
MKQLTETTNFIHLKAGFFGKFKARQVFRWAEDNELLIWQITDQLFFDKLTEDMEN